MKPAPACICKAVDIDRHRGHKPGCPARLSRTAQSPFIRPCGCSPLWSAAPGGHDPRCPRNDEPRPPHWWENPHRLPRCAVCRKFLQVQVTRLGAGTLKDRRMFTVSCHGESQAVVLTATEAGAMRGYSDAFTPGYAVLSGP